MLESLEIKRERIEELKKINEHLDLQRNDLLKQVKQAVDAPGGKDHPKNKPTISRLLKEAKAKQGVIDSNTKMMEMLTDQCSTIEAVLYRQGDVEALSAIPDMKSTVENLTKAIDATNDLFQEVKDANDEFQGVLGTHVSHDIDDDELAAALGELELDGGQGQSAASAAAALPTLAHLPPAGSKALPAHGAAAHAEVEDDELERIKCSM
jgi:myosin heavy subunit